MGKILIQKLVPEENFFLGNKKIIKEFGEKNVIFSKLGDKNLVVVFMAPPDGLSSSQWEEYVKGFISSACGLLILPQEKDIYGAPLGAYEGGPLGGGIIK